MLTKEEWHNLNAKADWEGGWPEFVLGYGAPVTSDPEFNSRLHDLNVAWAELFNLIGNHIEAYGEFADEEEE